MICFLLPRYLGPVVPSPLVASLRCEPAPSEFCCSLRLRRCDGISCRQDCDQILDVGRLSRRGVPSLYFDIAGPPPVSPRFMRSGWHPHLPSCGSSWARSLAGLFSCGCGVCGGGAGCLLVGYFVIPGLYGTSLMGDLAAALTERPVLFWLHLCAGPCKQRFAYVSALALCFGFGVMGGATLASIYPNGSPTIGTARLGMPYHDRLSWLRARDIPAAPASVLPRRRRRCSRAPRGLGSVRSRHDR